MIFNLFSSNYYIILKDYVSPNRIYLKIFGTTFLDTKYVYIKYFKRVKFQIEVNKFRQFLTHNGL